MNKKIIKEVNQSLFTMFVGIIFIVIIIGGLLGIFYLGDIHWLFYGLIPVYMWLILYFLIIIDDKLPNSKWNRMGRCCDD